MQSMRRHDGRGLKIRTVILFVLVVCAAPAATLRDLGAEPAQAAAGSQPSGRPVEGKKPQVKLPSPLPEWPDVDQTVPPVVEGVRCSLPEVLRFAGERVQDLVTTLPQFTATERVQHQERDKAGNWRVPETVVFNYLAELREIRPGMLTADETRNGSRSPEVFPAKLADFGLPAIVLVFHPYFADEYSMSCEGLGEWEGHPAWQVRFQQRPDRAARIAAYVAGNRSFPKKLKGRAWIAADSYQIVRLETDLLEPIPEVRLIREHLVINYRPVRFLKNNVELWLPESAQVYMSVRGRFFRREHTFSDYLLFSVDVNQKIAEPKEP